MIPTTTTLQTKNYRLRIPDESDFDLIFSASRFPDFNKGMLWEPPASKAELIQPLKNSWKSWRDGTGYSFTIESEEARLGRVSIRKTDEPDVWNVGYWTHPDFQGRGIMTEVLGRILDFGFDDLGATKITAQTAVWNTASEKVLLHNHFTFVKYIEQGFQKNNEWVAENEFNISAEVHRRNRG